MYWHFHSYTEMAAKATRQSGSCSRIFLPDAVMVLGDGPPWHYIHSSEAYGQVSGDSLPYHKDQQFEPEMMAGKAQWRFPIAPASGFGCDPSYPFLLVVNMPGQLPYWLYESPNNCLLHICNRFYFLCPGFFQGLLPCTLAKAGNLVKGLKPLQVYRYIFQMRLPV